MGIRRYKPTTPGTPRRDGQRFRRADPGRQAEKSAAPSQDEDRRPQQPGQITARHRGGGHKQTYRLIDFRRNKDGVPARVDSIQYDPNRSARIALLHYVDGEKRYILAPNGLKPATRCMSGPDAPPSVGNCLPLENIPLGMPIHNIELQPGRGGRLVPLGRRRARRWPLARPIGPRSPAQRRNSPRAGRLPGDDRRDRQFGSHERRASARPAAIAGWVIGRTSAARP